MTDTAASLHLRGDLHRRLRMPPEVAVTGSRRTVTVMGCLRFVVDLDKRSTAFQVVDNRGCSYWYNSPWNLRNPVLGTAWSGFVLDDYRFASRDFPGALEGQCLLAWEKFLIGEAHRSRLLPALGTATARALALDPSLVELARTIAPFRTDSSDYTSAWRHEATWRQLASEGPELAPILRAVERTRIPDEWRNYRALKRFLLEAGAGRAGWRFLCRHGRDALAAAQAFGPRNRLTHTLACIGRTLGAWKGEALQPTLLECTALAADITRLGTSFAWPERLIGDANEACLAAQDDDDRFGTFVEDELLPMLAWFVEERPPLGRARLARGWKGVVRAQGRWVARREAEIDGYPWECPIDDIASPCGRWMAIPLRSPDELEIEGVVMANCVRDRAGACAMGATRIFSIREAASGRRVATLGVEWGLQGVRGHEVLGHCNRRVGPAIAGFAAQIERRCAEAPRPRRIRTDAEEARLAKEVEELLASLMDDEDTPPC